MAGLSADALDLSSERWEDIERYNSCLARLFDRRKPAVVVEEPLVKSNTAWKCAVLQQALLYRVTMLANGCAREWNSGNIVCSLLCGRALLETVALSLFIGDELKALAKVADVVSIDNFLNERLFATRDKAIIGEGLGHRARSVLAYIDRLDKMMKGTEVRDTYEFMSEWCHPNGSGLLFTYGEIDGSTGTVTFSEASPKVKGVQGHVVTCFMLILFMEPLLTSFDELIPLIAQQAADSGLPNARP
jgi:hypothetical protein